jgi:hypothetical protein
MDNAESLDTVKYCRRQWEAVGTPAGKQRNVGTYFSRNFGVGTNFCDQFRLWQRNFPALPVRSAALGKTKFKKQFVPVH